MSTPPPSTPEPTEKKTSKKTRPGLSTWQALQTTLLVACIAATLFTLWTPDSITLTDWIESMSQSFSPKSTAQVESTPTEVPAGVTLIGIVSGHMGNDSGSVCADGLTEADVNLKIATLLKQDLLANGYTVDLLDEFDPKLNGYKAAVLISIHNDSCDYVNDEATGFKVASAQSNLNPEAASQLTACLVDRYRTTTGLSFHYNSITVDMTQYHAFDEIDSTTPAAIIETGFLNLDRTFLTQNTDTVALGIYNGILCFLNHEVVEPTPSSVP
jgi:N-acetylmuramoyl-L-alanine amidase